MWVKHVAYGGGGDCTDTLLVDSGSGHFQMCTGSTLSQRTYLFDTAPKTVVKGKSEPLNSWYMYTVTWDSTNIRLYYNDTLVNTTAAGAIGNNATSLRLGNNAGTENFFGTIDALGFWDDRLNSTEITQLFNAGAGCQLGDSCFSGGAAVSYFSLNATDIDNLYNVHTFNATVNGTTFNTTNGTIKRRRAQLPQQLVHVERLE
jgi:hypothetical protein